MKISTRSRLSSKSGFGLLQLMVVLVVTGILTTIIYPEIRDTIQRAKDGNAEKLQEELNTWYSTWTHNGAIHNSTTTNRGEMANVLLNLATSASSDAGTPRAAGDTWVDETRLVIRGKSLSGAIRMEMKRPYVLSGSATVIDNDYDVTFDPRGTSNKGTFIVAVRSDS